MTTTRSVFALLGLVLTAAVSAGEYCVAIDGSTLRCGRDRGERIRVEGLSAPNLKAPGGQQARQRLQKRIQAGEVVIERKGRDKYGRTLGRVYVNGNRVSQLDVSPKSGRATR